MSKTIILVFSVILVLGLVMSVSSVSADEIEDWMIALRDGKGDEFIMDLGLGDNFFLGVQFAAQWVAYHMSYEADPSGDVWTTADQQFAEITIGTENSGTGDCEDYAILLCALLRFHTLSGISAKNVWVVVGTMILPGQGVVSGHAWVAAKLPRLGIIYIEPQTGSMFRGNLPGYGGHMITFNDQWVKGGGRYLAGPPE